MPVAAILGAVLVGTGAAAAIGTTVAAIFTAATVSTAVATAIGAGVISGGVSLAQGKSISDSLKSAVIGGVVSFVGGSIAGEVTSGIRAEAIMNGELSFGAANSIGGVAGAMVGNAASSAISATLSGRDPIAALIKGGLTAGLTSGVMQGVEAVTSKIPGFNDLAKDHGATGAATQRAINAGLASGILGKNVDSAIVNSVLGSMMRSGGDYIKNGLGGGTSPSGGFGSGMGAAGDFGLRLQTAYGDATSTGQDLDNNVSQQKTIVADYQSIAADIEAQRTVIQGNLDKYNAAKNDYEQYPAIVARDGFTEHDRAGDYYKYEYSSAGPDESGWGTTLVLAPSRKPYLDKVNQYATLVNDALPGYETARTAAEGKINGLTTELDGLKARIPTLEKTLIAQKETLDTSLLDFQKQEEAYAQNVIKAFDDTVAAKTSVEGALGRSLTDEQLDALLKTGDVTTAAQNYIKESTLDDLRTSINNNKTLSESDKTYLLQNLQDDILAQALPSSLTVTDSGNAVTSRLGSAFAANDPRIAAILAKVPSLMPKISEYTNVYGYAAQDGNYLKMLLAAKQEAGSSDQSVFDSEIAKVVKRTPSLASMLPATSEAGAGRGFVNPANVIPSPEAIPAPTPLSTPTTNPVVRANPSDYSDTTEEIQPWQNISTDTAADAAADAATTPATDITVTPETLPTLDVEKAIDPAVAAEAEARAALEAIGINNPTDAQVKTVVDQVVNVQETTPTAADAKTTAVVSKPELLSTPDVESAIDPTIKADADARAVLQAIGINNPTTTQVKTIVDRAAKTQDTTPVTTLPPTSVVTPAPVVTPVNQTTVGTAGAAAAARTQAAANARNAQIQTAGTAAATALQQFTGSAPTLIQQATQETNTPIYGKAIKDFDFSQPFDFNFFKPSDEKLGTKATQPTKIASGGYLDDLLAEQMSVDDLLKLLR